MSGEAMFGVIWLSMMSTVYAWGAVMIVACRVLEIRPRKAFFLDGDGHFGNWALFTVLTVLWLPVVVGLLAYESVQLQREVNR